MKKAGGELAEKRYRNDFTHMYYDFVSRLDDLVDRNLCKRDNVSTTVSAKKIHPAHPKRLEQRKYTLESFLVFLLPMPHGWVTRGLE